METVIQRLTWQDFETLTDLIFRGAGWQRLSETGGKQKTLDLDLISPLTHGEDRRTGEVAGGPDRLQGVPERGSPICKVTAAATSSSTRPTATLTPDAETDDLKLWTGADIARLTVRYGLTEWVLDKAG